MLVSALIAGSIVDSKAAEEAAAPLKLSKEGGKARRLLQRFKKRQQRFEQAQSEQSAATMDVGLLANDKPRFLQETDYEYFCPRETCPKELCDCAESGGALEDCTTELQNVCRTGNLGDCVFKEYVAVYESVYCPFVGCVSGGFRENQCDCAFYDLYCDRLHSDECLTFLGTVESDSPDKKPFFGCDENELQNVCDQAKSCKNKGDLQGLPMGTWKGAGVAGLPNSSEKARTAAVVAGTVVSTMLLLAE